MKWRTAIILALLFASAVCGLGMLIGRFLVDLVVRGLMIQ